MKLKQCKAVYCRNLHRNFDSTGQYATGPFYCSLRKGQKLSEVETCPTGKAAGERERERERERVDCLWGWEGKCIDSTCNNKDCILWQED